MAVKETAVPEKAGRDDKPTFSTALNNFLRKNRVVFITLLVVVLVAILVAAIWTLVDSRISSSSAKGLEKVEESMQAWGAMAEGPESQSKADEILAELDALALKYGKRYVSQKALFLSGQIYAERSDWANAEKKYTQAADLNTDSSVAFFALQEAAVAAEEQQHNEAAIALWKRVVESKSGSTIGMPHAYFALGTLYEESKQYSEASASYDKLVSDYPDNDWTKLARDRIILLKARGLLP